MRGQCELRSVLFKRPSSLVLNNPTPRTDTSDKLVEY